MARRKYPFGYASCSVSATSSAVRADFSACKCNASRPRCSHPTEPDLRAARSDAARRIMDPAKTTLHLSPVLHLEVACGEVAVVWEGGRNRGMHFFLLRISPPVAKPKIHGRAFFAADPSHMCIPGGGLTGPSSSSSAATAKMSLPVNKGMKMHENMQYRLVPSQDSSRLRGNVLQTRTAPFWLGLRA